MKVPSLEALKEVLRWGLSIAIAWLILLLGENINLIPEVWEIGDLGSVNARYIVQFFLLPALIRFADKLKHERAKLKLFGTRQTVVNNKPRGIFPF